jgi:hypothetical protein
MHADVNAFLSLDLQPGHRAMQSNRITLSVLLHSSSLGALFRQGRGPFFCPIPPSNVALHLFGSAQPLLLVPDRCHTYRLALAIRPFRRLG